MRVHPHCGLWTLASLGFVFGCVLGGWLAADYLLLLHAPPHVALPSTQRWPFSPPQLLIAVPTPAGDVAQRQLIRDTWAHDLPDNVCLRFYVDVRTPVERDAIQMNESDVVAFVFDAHEHVGQHLANGAHFMRDTFVHALDHHDFTHLLRLDADGYLCVDHLVFDLRAFARERFLAGNWWCTGDLTRADESYLLMSRDVARAYVSLFDTYLFHTPKSLRTGALLLGYYSWFMDIQLYDDADRIHSHQNRPIRPFPFRSPSSLDLHNVCDAYLYVHRIKTRDVMLAFNDSARTNKFVRRPLELSVACRRAMCNRRLFVGLPSFNFAINTSAFAPRFDDPALHTPRPSCNACADAKPVGGRFYAPHVRRVHDQNKCVQYQKVGQGGQYNVLQNCSVLSRASAPASQR